MQLCRAVQGGLYNNVPSGFKLYLPADLPFFYLALLPRLKFRENIKYFLVGLENLSR